MVYEIGLLYFYCCKGPIFNWGLFIECKSESVREISQVKF